MEGQVLAASDAPVPGAVVLVSDEGTLLATVVADAEGRFRIDALPASGRVTVRATQPDAGSAQVVVALGGDLSPLQLVLSLQGCMGYVDLPDPALLVSPAFLESWASEPLAATCPECPVYRWFWERPGLAPAVLRVDYTPDGVRSTIRAQTVDGWTERSATLSPRRASRLDRAIGRSGYWQLEHLDLSTACFSAGSEWTVEAIASPGYRAVYRWAPTGTPIALLGREWLRAARVRVRRRDFL